MASLRKQQAWNTSLAESGMTAELAFVCMNTIDVMPPQERGDRLSDPAVMKLWKAWLNLEPADEDKNEEKLDANTQELEEVEEDLGGITLSAGKKICHHFFLVKHFRQPNFVTFVNTVTNVR